MREGAFDESKEEENGEFYLFLVFAELLQKHYTCLIKCLKEMNLQVCLENVCFIKVIWHYDTLHLHLSILNSYRNGVNPHLRGANWKAFARHNALELGDVCVFELTKRSPEIMLKVTIYRVVEDANADKSQGEYVRRKLL